MILVATLLTFKKRISTYNLADRKEQMFDKSIKLKNEVMEIINTFKSVKDDIASLKQSISHLSSLVQESARVSIVKGVSILNNEESKEISDDDFASLTISPDASHHEIIIRNNICKLKRDISRKIMNSQHLSRIANHFPQEGKTNLNEGFRISVVEGERVNYEEYKQDFITKEMMGDLEKIESNLNSIIPSYEHTSILTENKSSIILPDPKSYQVKMVSRNNNLQPDAIKRRLNSDIQKCHFYENL